MIIMMNSVSPQLLQQPASRSPTTSKLKTGWGKLVKKKKKQDSKGQEAVLEAQDRAKSAPPPPL